MSEETFRLRLTPLEMIMKRLLTRLATKDPADIFAEPVPLDDVRDREIERERYVYMLLFINQLLLLLLLLFIIYC